MLHHNDLESADNTQTVDVTGGMGGELDELLELTKIGIESEIINASHDNNTNRALKGEKKELVLDKENEGKKMISNRKLEHLLLCKNCNVEYRKKTGFEEIELIHTALSRGQQGRYRYFKDMRQKIRFTIHNIWHDCVDIRNFNN